MRRPGVSASGATAAALTTAFSDKASLRASKLSRPDGNELAFLHLPGEGPGIIFCPGFQSSMRGIKSRALWDWCISTGRECTNFDYYGHGESTPLLGNDSGGTIGRWLDDTLAVFDSVAQSDEQVVVGSSMGAWIAVLATLARPERVKGILGIASAPDFTVKLKEKIVSDAELSRRMNLLGHVDLPTVYDEKGCYRIYSELLDEAESHLLLQEESVKIGADLPVTLIHGMSDADISWESSRVLLDRLESSEVELQLVKTGDHRLSSPPDLDRMVRALDQLVTGDK